ncbi:MAG: hypothetical protein KAS39_01480, partial [Actinomycetia bacterium]|nr:hypothetical protein [Actinomycetes bacterium]
MEIAPFVLLGLVIIFQLLDIFFPKMNQRIKLSLEGTQAWGVFLFSFLLIKQSLGLRTGYILGFPFNSILPKRV